MKKLFNESDDFAEVYLKGDGIFTTLSVKDLVKKNSVELVVSTGTQDDIERINTEEAVVINNRLYIYGVVSISSPKSIFEYYSKMNLFNIDWFDVAKVEGNEGEYFQAFGWDNEKSIPVFTRFVPIKNEKTGKITVGSFTNDVLGSFLPKLILQRDKEILFEAFSKISVVDLTKPIDDTIVMTKWFVENNLIKTVERRLIEKLAKMEVVITANAYRSGMNEFLRNIGITIGFNYITGGYKDKLGYSVIGSISDYEFELYIAGYTYTNIEAGSSSIGVYPDFNQMNFVHLNGLIKSLVGEVKNLETQMFEVFTTTERPDIFLLSNYSCSIDYKLVVMDREACGFSVYMIDSYGEVIFMKDGEMVQLSFKTYFKEDSEPNTFKVLEVNKRFAEDRNFDTICSLRKVSLDITDTTVAIKVEPGESIESIILKGDKKMIEEQVTYFAPLLRTSEGFDLEATLIECLK